MTTTNEKKCAYEDETCDGDLAYLRADLICDKHYEDNKPTRQRDDSL